MSRWRWNAQPVTWLNAGWWLLQLIALVALGYAVWQQVGPDHRVRVETA